MTGDDDGDGIPDHLDNDDDGDGISDADEGNLLMLISTLQGWCTSFLPLTSDVPCQIGNPS